MTLNVGIEQVIGVRYEAPDNAPGESSGRHVAARFTPEDGGRYRARLLRPGGQCALAVLDARNRAVASGSPEQWRCP